MTEPLLSVAAIVQNEEAHLEACLQSVAGLGDEIVLVDAESTDRTREIATAFTNRVYVAPFTTFPRQRNLALEHCRGAWVFFIDADERCSPALAAEIRGLVERETVFAGAWVPRLNYMFGHLVRHAGWWPDYQLRLLRRQRGRYDERRQAHELLVLPGETTRLQQPLVHLNYSARAQFHHKQRRYAHLEAQSLFDKGARARAHHLAVQPLREFRRRYLQLQGFRDGRLGLWLSGMMAYYTFVTYRELWRLGQQPPPGRAAHGG